MARTNDKLALLLLALAIGGAYLAIHYDIRWIIALMIGAGGVFMLLSGLRMIVTRRARVPSGGSDLNHRLEHHSGFTAQLWGILYAMMSAVLLGIAYGIWLSRDSAPDGLWLVPDSPLLSGLIIIIGGAGIAIYGLTRLLARREAFVETRASPTGRFFMGIYACVLGTLILVFGLVRTFAPELLSALGHWIGELVNDGIRRL